MHCFITPSEPHTPSRHERRKDSVGSCSLSASSASFTSSESGSCFKISVIDWSSSPSSNENNWRSQNVPKELVEKVKAIYSEELTELDCACLFWYVRNSLFFYQGLDKHPKVLLWKYEDLVHNPEYHFTNLSSILGFELTQYAFSNAFSSESIRKESPKEVHSAVKALCEDLLVKLDRYK